MVPSIALLTPLIASGFPSVVSGGQASAQGPSHFDLPLPFWSF